MVKATKVTGGGGGAGGIGSPAVLVGGGPAII